MGDDTPALQAVLDADVWRKHLLREQDVSPACYYSIEYTTDDFAENHQGTCRIGSQPVTDGRHISRCCQA